MTIHDIVIHCFSKVIPTTSFLFFLHTFSNCWKSMQKS